MKDKGGAYYPVDDDYWPSGGGGGEFGPIIP